MTDRPITRRRFGAVCSALAAAPLGRAAAPPPFRLRYLLATSLYGSAKLADILSEVAKAGCEAVDIWAGRYGGQREQIDALGLDAAAELFQAHGVRVGALTMFGRGKPLSKELDAAKRLGATDIVTGSESLKAPLAGPELKAAVKAFAEKMKPTAAAAAERRVTIGIENHVRALCESPDAIRWLGEFAPPGLGVALAPFHLPQDPVLIAGLVRDLGPKMSFFYAWQTGKGSGDLPKPDAVKQLPGRGPLDFGPIVSALRSVEFHGYTEIYMHNSPRGTPIHPSVADTTAELSRVRREYLQPLVG